MIAGTELDSILSDLPVHNIHDYKLFKQFVKERFAITAEEA